MKNYFLVNIFRKTLRDNRAGAIGWGVGLGFILVVTAAAYSQIIGSMGPDRARLVAETAKALQSFSFMLGEVTDISTIGGFITVRALGYMPLIIGLWAAVAGIGALRGEEGAGSLELLLSTPHSRASVFRDKGLGLLVSIVVLLVLTWLGLVAGIASAGQPGDVNIANLLEYLLSLFAITVFWCAVGLLVSQFVSIRRTASSITGGLIFGTYLLDNLFTSNSSLGWLSWLMPFHYYAVSKPLTPGRMMEWGAWLVLIVLTSAITVVTAFLFTRRDIGSVIHIRRSGAVALAPERKSSGWLLGSPTGKGIRDLLWPTLLWGLGLGLYAAIVVSTTESVLGPMQDMVKNLGFLSKALGSMATADGFLSYSLFTFLPAVLSAYAIFQVSGWADDEEEGRMETLTAMPLPRWRILLARYVAFALSLAGVLVITGVFIWASAVATNTPISGDRAIGALATGLPVTLIIAAIGLFFATWLKRPGAAVPTTIAIVVVMFFADFLGAAFNLPDAVLNVSIFHLYGRPLLDGVQWAGTVAVSVAAIALALASLVGFQRRDISK